VGTCAPSSAAVLLPLRIVVFAPKTKGPDALCNIRRMFWIS
jgi:hypothetical protein